MQVAAVQTTPVAADIESNATEHARLIVEAAGLGASVCVFPELSLTGYELDASLFMTEDDPRLTPIRDACREHGVHAFVGAPLSTEDGVLMATVVIGPTGDTLGHYGKRHLHDAEAEFFVPGGHHLLLEIDDWRLGFAICYDAAVPEHATAVSEGGADVYVVSALFTEGSEDRLTHQMTSAAKHGMWVVLAQFAGHTGGYDTCGGSGVWRPGGDVEVQVGKAPAIAMATLVRP
jgi:predicted amidohydrolase